MYHYIMSLWLFLLADRTRAGRARSNGSARPATSEAALPTGGGARVLCRGPFFAGGCSPKCQKALGKCMEVKENAGLFNQKTSQVNKSYLINFEESQGN